VDFWSIFGPEAAMVRDERTLSEDFLNHKKWQRCA
jgi:hypothetical protein